MAKKRTVGKGGEAQNKRAKKQSIRRPTKKSKSSRRKTISRPIAAARRPAASHSGQPEAGPPKACLTPDAFQELIKDDLPTINARAVTDDDRKEQFQAYHRIGAVVDEHLPDKRQYGGYTVKEWAKKIGRKPGWLYKVRDFARKFNGTSLKRLLKHVDKIRWQHVVLLLAAKSKKDRQYLLRDAIAFRWTPADLGRKIQGTEGSRRKGSGRSLAKPDPNNPEAGLRQIVDSTELWRRRYHDVWNAEDSPLRALAKDTSHNTGKSVSKKLDAADQVLLQLAAAARKAIALVQNGRKPDKALAKSKAERQTKKAAPKTTPKREASHSKK